MPTTASKALSTRSKIALAALCLGLIALVVALLKVLPGDTEVPAGHVKSDEIKALQSLPILIAGGPVATAFPKGAGLADPERVRTVAEQIATEAGLESSLAALWSGLAPQRFKASVWPRGQETASPTPYAYPSLDEFKSSLTDQLVKSHSSELVELSSLFTLAALHASDVPGGRNGPFFRFGLAAGQVIAERVSSVTGSCSARLTHAYVVSLGPHPRHEYLKKLYESAIEACPGDPTPGWFWGHRLISDSVERYGLDAIGVTRATAMESAVEFFSNWATQTPDSALGHAGLADTLLTQAFALRGQGSSPFSVREDLTRAKAEYRRAASITPRAEFTTGEAKASAMLGESQAADLIDRLAQSHPRSVAVRQAATYIHETLKDFSGAADHSGAQVDAVDGLQLMPYKVGFAEAGWVGGFDVARAVLIDGTEPVGGTETLDWFAFTPEASGSDMAWAPSCRKIAQRRNLVLAGDLAGARAVTVRFNKFGDFEHNPNIDQFCTDLEYDAAGSVIALQGKPVDPETSYEQAQDLWRYAGDLTKARSYVDRWIRSSKSALAYERLGEINVLEKNYRDAKAAFKTAIDLGRSNGDHETLPGENFPLNLKLGFACEKLGDVDCALASYQEAVDRGVDALSAGDSGAFSDYISAQSRIGALLMDSGRTSEAMSHLKAAAVGAAALEDAQGYKQDLDLLGGRGNPTSGVEMHDYALALLEAGEHLDEAKAFATRALAHDPLNPQFKDTLARLET